MYEVPFKIGIRLPLRPLVTGVLSWYEIAPDQLMPNSWRILLSLEALATRLGFDYSIVDLFCTNYLRRHDTKTGKFQLVPNPRKAVLISGLISSDKNSKTKYVLILADAFSYDGVERQSLLFWKCAWEYTFFLFPCFLRCPDVDFSSLFCRCFEESSCSLSNDLEFQ